MSVTFKRNQEEVVVVGSAAGGSDDTTRKTNPSTQHCLFLLGVKGGFRGLEWKS
jgi:hypothetical protein